MDLGRVSKAIGGAIGAATAGGGVAIYALPPDTPWYGYVVGAAVSAALGWISTYLAPQNRVDASPTGQP